MAIRGGVASATVLETLQSNGEARPPAGEQQLQRRPTILVGGGEGLGHRIGGGLDGGSGSGESMARVG